MTENEDIEKILYMGVGRSGIDNENSKIAKALNELMQHRAIGTVEEFKSLKEKNEPKKPIALDQWGEYWKCPACGKYAVNDLGCKYKYCPNCGTEFDWE